MQALVDTLTGDPDMYGEFFSEPVEIESVAVYPIENYGSAVAPFYTVLSVWVGCIIMVAIVKVKVSKSKYPDATPTQLFFGRGMFFIAMGQVQTLITVLGDLFILKDSVCSPAFVLGGWRTDQSDLYPFDLCTGLLLWRCR